MDYIRLKTLNTKADTIAALEADKKRLDEIELTAMQEEQLRQQFGGYMISIRAMREVHRLMLADINASLTNLKAEFARL